MALPLASFNACDKRGTRVSSLWCATGRVTIPWRGLLTQHAGRPHSLRPAKREVVIYDYVDSLEPMLAKMATKRRPDI